jgi:site-specific DNA-methyltransferase (adenine-specific)
MSWNVQQRDCLSWMRALATESIDLIITDPAYESLEKWRKIGTTTRLKQSKGSSNEWFPIFPNERFPEFFQECARVLKRNTHLYVFCDQETGFYIKPIAEAIGFKFWKAITWNKMARGMGYHYPTQTEWIMFFEKGKRRLNTNKQTDFFDFPIDEDPAECGGPDVINASRVRGYPTEKPVSVIMPLIFHSSDEGDLVIDPFTGSGSCGEAALRLRRHFYGCDLESKAVLLATDRLTKTEKEMAP